MQLLVWSRRPFAAQTPGLLEETRPSPGLAPPGLDLLTGSIVQDSLPRLSCHVGGSHLHRPSPLVSMSKPHIHAGDMNSPGPLASSPQTARFGTDRHRTGALFSVSSLIQATGGGRILKIVRRSQESGQNCPFPSLRLAIAAVLITCHHGF